MTDDQRTISRRASVDGRYAWYVCIVLAIVNLYNTMDRYSLAILSEDIRHSFRLSDSELGFLTGTAFAVFYAVFSYPVARLADRWNRTRLLAIGLTIWSAATAMSGVASSYHQLALLRLGLGIGEATVSPTGYSLLADWFSKPRRATPMGLFGAGLYLGAGLSMLVGGYIVTEWNSAPLVARPLGLAGWQVAFLVLGLPGLLLAAWVFTLREPTRGQSEGTTPPVESGIWAKALLDLGAIVPPFTFWDAARRGRPALLVNALAALIACLIALGLATATGDWMQWSAVGFGYYAAFSAAMSLRANDRATFALTWATPSFMLAVVGFCFITTITTVIIIWTGPLAVRRLGLDSGTVGLLLGSAMAIGGVGGTIAGGKLSDIAIRRNPRGRLWVALAAVIVPMPFTMVMCVTHDPTLFFLCFVPVASVGKIWLAGGAATIQELVLPRMRGTATNVYFLLPTLLGSALAPYFVGKISEATGDLGVGLGGVVLASGLISVVALSLCTRGLPEAEASKSERAAEAERQQ